jgi:hypothetical protein
VTVTAGFDGSLLICFGHGGRELPGRGGTPSRDIGTCRPRALRAMETFTVSGATGARSLALVSGIVGIAAALFLIGFFALDSYGVRPGRISLGTINDVLGVVQFLALAPVAWALGRRLPATRTVRVATVIAVVAMLAFAVLGVLLVARVLTFEQQIGPLMVTIVAIYGWLLAVNLVAHRTRTLPRAVSSAGVLVAAHLLTALVLIGAGYVLLPGAVGQMATWLGYGLGVVGWLGLPLYALLLAARVFGRPESPPRFVPADPDHVTGAVRP